MSPQSECVDVVFRVWKDTESLNDMMLHVRACLVGRYCEATCTSGSTALPTTRAG